MVYMYNARLAHQVRSVLAKVELCRTKALGGHVYRCSGCNYELPVYNSCRDRHCPQCSGGQRAKWLEKTSELFIPNINYFQIVFTLPSGLSSFALGNRQSIFDLLLRAAWQALDSLLRQTLGVAPAATLVLHTWNQELDVHPHVHALVPGSFPTLDGQRWITPQHPKHKRRRQAYLCDVADLSERFRHKFLKGLRLLYKQGKLNFEQESSAEPVALEAWLAELEALDWNVYIQGPPSRGADPAQVAKYLARYMTGGPSVIHGSSRMMDKKFTFGLAVATSETRVVPSGSVVGSLCSVGRSTSCPKVLQSVVRTVATTTLSAPRISPCAAR